MIETIPLPSPAPEAPAQTNLLEQAVFLGSGAQYQVYDTGDERVCKVPQTIEASVAAVGEWHKGDPTELTEYATMVTGFRDKGASYVKAITAKYPESSRLFGNPNFAADGSVSQDKIKTMGDALAGADDKEARRLIESYVSSIRQTWEYGCYDWVFNLVVNSGVAKDGSVIVSDFGEMGFDKSTMHGLISDERWASSYDTKNRLTPEQRGYFLGYAKAKLSHDELDRLWASKL